jgi:hypothetical protein
LYESNTKILAGNPHDILRAIADKRKLEPAGEPSLQNAIEVARAGMRQVRLLAADVPWGQVELTVGTTVICLHTPQGRL